MTRVPRPVAAVLAVVFLLVTAPFGAPANAQDDLSGMPRPLLDIDVVTMDPRVVTAENDELQLTVEVTNTSNTPITDVQARLQLGQQQTTPDEVQQALSGGAATDSQHTPFEPVSTVLEPDDTQRLTITVDLRGGAGGLSFAEPGTYPLLINVNGQPQQAEPARLAELSMLLPVPELPGGTTGSAPQPGSVPRTTLLWPITSTPRVVSAPLDGTMVLANDRLGAEMREGGRLHALVSAAESARDDAVFGSLCFAVDPELVTTAAEMVDGYRVRDGAETTEGEFADTARSWLTSLRTLVDDQCVVTTPYARADVSALAETAPNLAKSAANRDDAVADELGVRPLSDVSWPSGPLTIEGTAAFDRAGKEVLVADGGRLADGQRLSEPTALTPVDGAGSTQRALPADALTTLAMTRDTASSRGQLNVATATDDVTISTQNALATLAFQARRPDGPKRVLVAPPHAWRAEVTELRWFLDRVDELATSDAVTLAPFAETMQAAESGSVTPRSGSSLTSPLPADVSDRISSTEAAVADLLDAMDVSPVAMVEPQDLLQPVHDGLIRATSTSFAADASAIRRAAADGRQQLDTLLGAVRVSDPGRTISLGSESAPILVSIRNQLPVDVTVEVALTNTTGLRPGQVGDPTVAANTSLNFPVPAEALRAGRFSVDVQLSAPGGTELGSPTRLDLASTQYGLITVIVTATTACALLLLSGRRIYRRLRSTPDEQEPRTEDEDGSR